MSCTVGLVKVLRGAFVRRVLSLPAHSLSSSIVLRRCAILGAGDGREVAQCGEGSR